jgi:23S rRNA pseudouridine1911/1915/1917 synthase
MKFLLEESGERVDSYLASQLSLSRSYLVSCIRQGLVKVNQKQVKPSYILKQGDSISLTISSGCTLFMVGQTVSNNPQTF